MVRVTGLEPAPSCPDWHLRVASRQWFYSILFPFLMSAAITTTNSDGSGGKVWFDFRYSNSLWILLTVLQNHAASSAFFIVLFTLVGLIEYS